MASPVVGVGNGEVVVQVDPPAVSAQVSRARCMECPCHELRPNPQLSPSTSWSASLGPRSTFNRFRISFAALFVNVTAVIWCGLYPCRLTRCATREVSTRVLPDPGPARIWRGTSGGAVTAGRSVGIKEDDKYLAAGRG